MTRQPTPANILGDVLTADATRPATIRNDAIKVDGGTQMRAQLDAATVAEYADTMTASGWGAFPPIIAYYDGSDYWLADGFHRLAAWRSIADFSDALIPADVRSGTRRDAILHAAGANASHGLRRTNADKRRAVETLLRDQEWAAWSNREISPPCAVPNRFVRRIKHDLGMDTSHETRYIHPKTGEETTMHTGNMGAKPVETDEQRRQRIRDNDRRMMDEINGTQRGPIPRRRHTRAARRRRAGTGALHAQHRRPARRPGRRRLDRAQQGSRQLLGRQRNQRHGERHRAQLGRLRRTLRQPAKAPTQPCADHGISNQQSAITHQQSRPARRRPAASMGAGRSRVNAYDAFPVPDGRVAAARHLMALYGAVIDSEEQYGSLTGRFSDTLGVKRDLTNMIAHLADLIAAIEHPEEVTPDA